MESTGQCLRVVSRAKPACYLVPTDAAYQTIIDPTRKVVETQTRETIETEFAKSQISIELGGIRNEVAALRGDVHHARGLISALSESFPSPGELKQFKQLLGMVPDLLRDWRESKGLPRDPP